MQVVIYTSKKISVISSQSVVVTFDTPDGIKNGAVLSFRRT